MKEGIPKSVYRAKGFVYFGIKGVEQKFIFQLVGARHTLKLDDWRGKTPSTDLVFIGKDIDKSSLKDDLATLVDEQPDDISGNLMNIFDYR
jgi:G3E family GTPase